MNQEELEALAWWQDNHPNETVRANIRIYGRAVL